MPLFSTALTLTDYAIQSNNPSIMSIVLSLLQGPSVFDDLPLITNDSLTARWAQVRYNNLPNTGWGAINSLPSPIKTTSTSMEDRVSLVREIIQIDRRLLTLKDWIDDPIQTQIDGVMGAHCFDMNWAFFNNDPAGEQTVAIGGQFNSPLSWAGLRTRMLNPGTYGVATVQSVTTGQQVVSPNLLVNAGPLDIRNNAAETVTAKIANIFIQLIDQVFAGLGSPTGTGCVIYTNWNVAMLFRTMVRTLGAGGGFSMTEDAYGKRILKYMDAKIVDIGFCRDQQTPIISTQQDVNGNNTTQAVGTSPGYTSLWIVRYGPKYFNGWQTNPLMPEHLGRSTEYGTYENILIDWGCGIKSTSPFSIAQVYGLQVY